MDQAQKFLWQYWDPIGDAFRTKPQLLPAVLAIACHVIAYNFTSQVLEYRWRLFTRVLGRAAVYVHAILLVASALGRDYFVQRALENTRSTLLVRVPYYNFSLSSDQLVLTGQVLFVLGIWLNLWTLRVLGIKGMYNGDSFGWLMSEPVTNGPFRLFQDPQYVGTSMAALGSALYYQSYHGVWLAVWMYFVFSTSVSFVEQPHMERVYQERAKSDLYSEKSKSVKGKKAKKDD